MKKKLLIIGPITIILAFILYKTCLILYYKDLNNYSTDFSKLKIDTKKVVTDKTLANTKFADVNIYIPTGFKKTTSKYSNENIYYIPENENIDDYSNMISIVKTLNCYESLYDLEKRLQTTNIDKLTKKNNINSEIDLIKYYYNKRSKNSIFTSSNDIKMNYLSDICVKNSGLNSTSDNYYYLEGDISGMAFYRRNHFSMKIYNKNKNEYYHIGLSKLPKKSSYKEIFTEEEINKIISSVYFDW